MKEIIDLLKIYTDGKKNTEKVEVSVLNLNRIITALERADLDGYSSRLWKAAYERGKAEAEQANALGKIREIRDKIIAEADYEDEYDDQDIAKGLYNAVEIIDKCMAESEDKLDGDPIDIDKAIEHYEGTLETLKGIDLEVDG